MSKLYKYNDFINENNNPMGNSRLTDKFEKKIAEKLSHYLNDTYTFQYLQDTWGIESSIIPKPEVGDIILKLMSIKPYYNGKYMTFILMFEDEDGYDIELPLPDDITYSQNVDMTLVDMNTVNINALMCGGYKDSNYGKKTNKCNMVFLATNFSKTTNMLKDIQKSTKSIFGVFGMVMRLVSKK